MTCAKLAARCEEPRAACDKNVRRGCVPDYEALLAFVFWCRDVEGVEAINARIEANAARGGECASSPAREGA